MSDDYTPRMKQRFRDELVPALQQELGLANVMQVPAPGQDRREHGHRRRREGRTSARRRRRGPHDITGQKPVVTKARKSIAGFKLREGMPIGAKVTLRGDRMWEFYDRLVSLALPRIRDFRGMSPRSFDGHGNYTMGVTEQLIFPEIDYDKVAKVRGMDITIVTTATTDDEGTQPAGRARLPVHGRSSRSTQAAEERTRHGEEGTEEQAAAPAEVPRARVHALPAVRASRAVYKRFLLCRICFRELAHAGELPGVTKASW